MPIKVAELADYMDRCPKQAGPEAALWLPHFLAAKSEELDWGLNLEFFRGKLADGSGVVLLDGLDEAPDRARRAMVVRLVENASGAYRNCRFVVTTRPQSFEGLKDFHPAQIEPLSPEAIETFLEHWCRKLYPDSPQLAQDHHNELTLALRERPEIQLMAQTPVMLTALAVVHYNERKLPEQRAELYSAILKWLAEAREKRPGRLKVERCLELLRELALAMQDHPGGRQVQVELGWAAEKLAGEFADAPERGRFAQAMRFLEEETADSGIIKQQGAHLLFAHLTFQEYLAALAIAGRGETAQRDLLLEDGKDGKLFLAEWREVALLLAGVLGMKQGKEKVDGIVSAILNRTGPGLPKQARSAGLIGRMVRDLRPIDYQPRDPAYAKLHEQVKAIFEPGRTRGIPLADRVAAAEALDQAPASHSRLLTPGDKRYWVKIPGGTFTIGGDREAHRSLPAARVTLDTFRIGKFPVTVWEYAGYLRDPACPGTGPPKDWDTQSLHPGWPVTGVAWDEARRYCQWASEKWAIRCKLPTEQQWEAAARDAAGRIYPWGPEEPDEHRANFSELNVGAPTPVGMFPDGNTPDGVADMAGNVFEWTLSKFDKDTTVLRGGCWDSLSRYLRAACRYGYEPEDWSDFIGFRCVREA